MRPTSRESAAAVDVGLPSFFLGWPTKYGWDDVAPRHWVEVWELGKWLSSQLGCDPRPRPTALQWLLLPQQLILGVVAGEVFHDDSGELTAVRSELAWYPDDLWLWLLACQWQRIGEEEAFVGRTLEVGDPLGSSIVASRLARDLMRLCFLIERKHAPYSKWLGTAFAELDAASEVGPLLESGDVVGAAEAVARRHNVLGVTAEVDPTRRRVLRAPVRRDLRGALRRGVPRARGSIRGSGRSPSSDRSISGSTRPASSSTPKCSNASPPPTPRSMIERIMRPPNRQSAVVEDGHRADATLEVMLEAARREHLDLMGRR